MYQKRKKRPVEDQCARSLLKYYILAFDGDIILLGFKIIQLKQQALFKDGRVIYNSINGIIKHTFRYEVFLFLILLI